MLVDQLREQLKNSDQEKSQILNDTNTNIERLESNLEFSTKANVIQREDYDLLQQKFDKHMKATNNINQDLKEEIGRLMDKSTKL